MRIQPPLGHNLLEPPYRRPGDHRSFGKVSMSAAPYTAKDNPTCSWNSLMEGPNRPEGKEYELMQRVLKLWERYKPLCLERLSVIEEAYAVAKSATLDSEHREKAESAAHKLAGALGSIGLPEGSKIASQIEALLQPENTLTPGQLSHLSELIAKLRSQLTNGPASPS